VAGAVPVGGAGAEMMSAPDHVALVHAVWATISTIATIPLQVCELLATMSVPAFIRYVRQPGGAMPAFTEKILSDQELMDIYAHLKTLPAARAPNESPLLGQVREK